MIAQWAGLRRVLVLAAILAAGCSHPGDKFVGKWVSKSNANDTIEIVRNGDGYLVVSGQSKTGASFKDGQLEIASMMGMITLTYIKSSDTLVMPGFFGQAEYERAK